MMRNLSKFLIFGTISCLISLVGCFKSSGGFSRSGGNSFADADAAVSKNIENLMGLSVGMTKAQVSNLSGIANYLEGYDWGSVWFYKIRTGGNEGTLSDKEVEKRYMPVVFDNTDRVMGYGSKFYDQTLSDLGAGQF
jgi:outer membrane protein assembly factor BamE (lipoprotein component of BamABCDE complex)